MVWYIQECGFRFLWDTLYKNNYYCRIFLISVAGAIAGIADQWVPFFVGHPV